MEKDESYEIHESLAEELSEEGKGLDQGLTEEVQSKLEEMMKLPCNSKLTVAISPRLKGLWFVAPKSQVLAIERFKKLKLHELGEDHGRWITTLKKGESRTFIGMRSKPKHLQSDQPVVHAYFCSLAYHNFLLGTSFYSAAASPHENWNELFGPKEKRKIFWETVMGTLDPKRPLPLGASIIKEDLEKRSPTEEDAIKQLLSRQDIKPEIVALGLLLECEMSQFLSIIRIAKDFVLQKEREQRCFWNLYTTLQLQLCLYIKKEYCVPDVVFSMLRNITQDIPSVHALNMYSQYVTSNLVNRLGLKLYKDIGGTALLDFEKIIRLAHLNTILGETHPQDRYIFLHGHVDGFGKNTVCSISIANSGEKFPFLSFFSFYFLFVSHFSFCFFVHLFFLL